MHYVVAFACLYFALLDTRVLNSYEELCIARVAAVNYLDRVLNRRSGEDQLGDKNKPHFSNKNENKIMI